MAIMVSATAVAMHAGEAPVRHSAADLASAYGADIAPLLATYCGSCHGQKKQKGEVDFSAIGGGEAALAPRALWRKVAHQLADRDMPPDGERQPSEAERAHLAAWIAGLRDLDPPNAGRVTSRRLNRVEYDHTIRDLLGVDAHPADDFPVDDVGYGFDNNGDVLSLSPLLMEKYLIAVDGLLDRIIAADQLDLHLPAGELNAVLDGRPDDGRVGTRQRAISTPGEVDATIAAPVDGAYTIRVRAGAEQAGKEPVRLALKVDGVVASEITVVAPARSPAAYSCRTTLAAGPHQLALIFLNPFSAAPVDAGAAPLTGKAAGPRMRTALIDAIEVVGPPAAAPGEAHRRIVVARPDKVLDKAAAARRIAESFATRAFRHPARPAEIEFLLGVFALADHQGETFSEAVKLMVKAALLAPEFLYRIEEERAPDADGNYALGDYDLAARLSYFLWSTMPDDELLVQAQGGHLREPAVLEAQVRRMLKSPRSRVMVESFAGQWLQLRKVLDARPDRKLFPEFTPELRQALYDEAIALVDGVLHEGRSTVELLGADYAWLNERLAKHYGIADVKGAQLRKVPLTDRNRGGLLGLGALLTATSMAERTSPVKRGRWVLEELLGAPPPPPPPAVPALEEQAKAAGPLGLRQLMERHRKDPACAGCHRTMDAIGFGLERFDAIGRWRDRDGVTPIDARGELPGGLAFDGPAGLKQALLARQGAFVRVVAGKLLGYALGRQLEDYDDAALDRIVVAAAADGDRLDRLVIAVALSFPFRYRHLAE